MPLHLHVRNESVRRHLYRRDALLRLAQQICTEEGTRPDETLELSVLFCDDPFIAELNRKYRKKNRPTDVLAFAQGPLPVRLYRSATPHVLGDIVISLETVERNCRCDRAAMRDEVRLLFCHGILHLLGYQHGTARDLAAMVVKQNDYLGRSARSRPKKR